MQFAWSDQTDDQLRKMIDDATPSYNAVSAIYGNSSFQDYARIRDAERAKEELALRADGWQADQAARKAA